MTSVTSDSALSGKIPNERALFSLIQGGDRDAFRSLYRQHQVPVYWAAFAVLRSPTDTEEIVTDTFMTLWTKRAAIDLVGESTLPWLVTTARYLAQNRVRAELRRRHDGLDDHTELPDTAASPEEEAVTREALDRIGAVIATMPAADQDIYRLCLVEDLSYKQAARVLGISHGSVRNRLSRVKLRLRSELELLLRGR